MKSIDQKKLVQFGAGKIGRSFIGQLFSRGGYEVVFIDVYKPVIDELNKRRNYNIIIKSEKDEVINIKNVRGIHADEEEKVVSEVATAGILGVSVGLNGLTRIFPLLAKGLMARHRIDDSCPLDIIIAENMRNADEYFRSELLKLLPGDYPLDKLAGLIETSIGKMVPIMKKKDILEDSLQIFAEPYNTLILNKKGFRNPIPLIDGLAPRENMKAWVDRKLFIHNLGHATAAYVGFLLNPEFKYMYEVLDDREVHQFTRLTMIQSAQVLLKKYAEEFTFKDLEEHIDDLLHRFRNKALGDTVFRVGCDLLRKLGPEDRLAGAVKEAVKYDLDYDKILYALVCGCHFRAADEEGKMLKEDEEFIKIYDQGIDHVLSQVCGFDPLSESRIFIEAAAIDRRLGNN